MQKDPSVVALGEMGLDYFHKFADRAHQRQLFEAQMTLAAELARPVVIHSREAIDDTLAVMKPSPPSAPSSIVLPAPPPKRRRSSQAGYWISFTGPITYKKNDALRDVVKMMPLDRLMVETDAPYLSPEPVRSHKTNEPALVMHTAAKAAEVKQITLEELDRLTTANAIRFFGWT